MEITTELRVGMCKCLRVHGKIDNKVCVAHKRTFRIKEVIVPGENPYNALGRQHCHLFIDIHPAAGSTELAIEIARFRWCSDRTVWNPDWLIWCRKRYPQPEMLLRAIQSSLTECRDIDQWVAEFAEAHKKLPRKK